ncbi:MAG: hypothetical protein K2M69_05960 [Muribaculaceae bacterium]|nr:hypothetical protein [Muribaculaceae bacterium]
MKKYKKTYAIFNLAEKHTTFHLGKTKVHVSFTGGQVTKQGVTPATFTTADPIVQLAIEHSADFKRGAISLQSQYPVQGEVNVGKNQRKPSRKPAADAQQGEPEALAPEQTAGALQEAASTEEDQDQQEGGKADVIEVSCRDVAKQYLQEHYGENPAPLRRIADIQECAAKYGITFNFV